MRHHLTTVYCATCKCWVGYVADAPAPVMHCLECVRSGRYAKEAAQDD